MEGVKCERSKEMAVDREEREYHLTPNGWVTGMMKGMFTGTTAVSVPDDRVLTLVWKMVQKSRHERESRCVVEAWRGSISAEELAELRAKFPPPFDPKDE
jgi:hypothetical protein